MREYDVFKDGFKICKGCWNSFLEGKSFLAAYLAKKEEDKAVLLVQAQADDGQASSQDKTPEDIAPLTLVASQSPSSQVGKPLQ